jgi:hypothetical protein
MSIALIQLRQLWAFLASVKGWGKGERERKRRERERESERERHRHRHRRERERERARERANARERRGMVGGGARETVSLPGMWEREFPTYLTFAVSSSKIPTCR